MDFTPYENDVTHSGYCIILKGSMSVPFTAEKSIKSLKKVTVEKLKRKRLIKNPVSILNQKTNEDFNKEKPDPDNFDLNSNLNAEAKEMRDDPKPLSVNKSCNIDNSIGMKK
jgi:hypothetical protein